MNINLVQKPEWYFVRNPLGKVPAIELDSGDAIYESLIISDYLDEIHPQPPLYNKNPLQKAKDRLLIETFSKVRIVCVYFIYLFIFIFSSYVHMHITCLCIYTCLTP